jgi:hypothetical protein
MVTVGYERLVQGRASTSGEGVLGEREQDGERAGRARCTRRGRMRGRGEVAAEGGPAIRRRARTSRRASPGTRRPRDSLSINYYAKGPGKSMVQLEHEKLKSAAEAKK